MTSQTYNLDGPKEFPFPYPVRSADQLTVEIVPGAAVAPGDYEVVGVGPTSTQVTVRYPNAPTSGGLQLKITRYVAPERVTQIDSPSDINVTNLNAEFNNVYEALTDFESYILDLVQTEVDAAIAAKEAAQLAAQEAEAAWDAFRDQYWGAYATDPSESPLGNPPDEGDLYWNTTADQWRVWNGTAWQQPDTAVGVNYDRRDYIATASQTTFAVDYDAPFVQVWVNGALIPPSDYTAVSGTDVVLDEGVPADTEVTVIGLGATAIDVLDGDAATVTTSTGTQLLPAALDKRVLHVPDIAALRALTGVQDGAAVRMTTTGRAGDFYFDASDLSAEVTADPQSGIYVAPDSDPTGASGAWAREATSYMPDHWGAAGDGQANDSAPMQAALDWLSAQYVATGSPQTLTLRPGAVYVERLVELRPGVNIDGGQSATLLKTPAGAETDEAALKWWRMLTVDTADWNSAEARAHRVAIKGVIFDGNLKNMNWTDNTYNQEQGHCLFLDGPSAGGDSEARARFGVYDCTFRNSVADGLSAYRNIDLIARNIEADNCFRGGFVATGGNSIIKLRGYRGENARFDIEVDGAGHDGIFATDYDISGVEVDRNGGGLRPGGIDFGGSRGGQFRLSNARVYTPPMNFSGQQDDPKKIIENSRFTLGAYSSSANRITWPAETLWRNIDFVVRHQAGETNYSAIHVYPQTATNCVMKFSECRMILDESVRDNEPSAVCRSLWLEPSNATGSDDNGDVSYILENCSEVGSWDNAVNISQGGTVVINGGSYSADKLVRLVSTSGRPAQVTVEGHVGLSDTVTGLFSTPGQVTQPGAFIQFSGAVFPRPVPPNSTVLTYPVIGSYSFPVDSAPVSSVGALRGAVAVLNLGALDASGDPVASRSWVAKTSSSTSAAFRLAGFSAETGTTAERPTLTAIDAGCQYFDTDLDADGTPIWWNGTAWVDATGATV